MTINLNDFVNKFVKVTRRDNSRRYGVIEYRNDFSEESIISRKPFVFDLGSGGVCYNINGRCKESSIDDLDIIEIERVKEPTTNPNPSSFLEWFSSEYGQYSFRSEAFAADCEIKDKKLLKRIMFKWIQAAYEAGTEQKVKQQP